MSDEQLFAPVHKQRAFEQVLAQLEELIVTGKLRPGDRLPNERDLSDQLDVSRPSLREALRVLDAMGIVEARPGAGAASGTVIASTPGETLSRLMRLHLALSHFPSDDFLQLRHVLEGWTVRRAAESHTDADIAALRDLLDKQAVALDDRDEFFALDAEFHVRVASLAGNELAGYIMQAIRAAMTLEMAELADVWESWRELLEIALDDHTRLLEAIAAGDGAAAEGVVVQHLSTYRGKKRRVKGRKSSRG